MMINIISILKLVSWIIAAFFGILAECFGVRAAGKSEDEDYKLKKHFETICLVQISFPLMQQNVF